ncbi:hypothetical protein V8G54_026215 [Vigna mungo]|uniref:Uncharacterized protein n=1 Tax=Vigna mungo TaxID=3915 RepID=A0AAQ3N010_VIGMU
MHKKKNFKVNTPESPFSFYGRLDTGKVTDAHSDHAEIAVRALHGAFNTYLVPIDKKQKKKFSLSMQFDEVSITFSLAANYSKLNITIYLYLCLCLYRFMQA